MILAVDTGYHGTEATVAGVLFSNWRDEAPAQEETTVVPIPASYRPGEFYRRELPGILQLIKEHGLRPECIVIDGYVYLDGRERPGLGRHLYDALDKKVPVIGVAKSAFRGISGEFRIYRGGSRRPLYVTAAGMELEQAKEWILSMQGRSRVPVLLKRADRLSRNR